MAFHLYDINEVFSNADGTVQFIEMTVGGLDGEEQWEGHSIAVTSGGVTHTFTFPGNLPSVFTANTSVLIATQGFADLGIVTPDFIVPAGFLFTAGGTINFGPGADSLTYASLPTDGTHSLSRAGATATASPTNFSGATGQMPSTGNVVTGTEGSDNLAGTSGSDTINALAGNDRIAALGGNDTVDGGAGTDTVELQAEFSALTTVASTHIAGPGFDLALAGVERIALTDRFLVFDTQPADPAWQAMAVLCAGFGEASARAQLGAWLDRTDLPATMDGIAQAMLDQYASGVSPHVLVDFLFHSIAGVSPTPDQVNQFANEVGVGKTFATNGALLAFAANLSQNTDKMVDFVGTQQVFYAT